MNTLIKVRAMSIGTGYRASASADGRSCVATADTALLAAQKVAVRIIGMLFSPSVEESDNEVRLAEDYGIELRELHTTSDDEMRFQMSAPD